MKRFFWILIIINLYCSVIAQDKIIYHYDQLNRLTHVNYPNGTVVTYLYDELGNRLSKVTHIATRYITFRDTICQGDSYNFYGENIMTTGTYMQVRHAANGIDSICTLVLTVSPLPEVSIAGGSDICEGTPMTLVASGAENYVWNDGSTGSTYSVSSSGEYMVVGTSHEGCTNTASKIVTVHPRYNVQINGEICQDESYYFNGQSLTSTGTYTQTLQSVNGCDSVVTLVLRVKSVPSPNIYVHGNTTICEGESVLLLASGGDSFLWNNNSTQQGITVTQSGCYTVCVSNSNGCSATASVDITVHPAPFVTVTGNSYICQDGSTELIVSGANSYLWSNGSTDDTLLVSAPGIYSVIGTNNYGCTRSVSLAVNQYPVYQNTRTLWICEGENYDFYGQNLNSAGDYTHTLQSVNGCDSVILLHLRMNPTTIPIISGDTVICEGQSTTLVASGGYNFVWNENISSMAITVSQSGVYVVSNTNMSGCHGTASVTVTVNPLPNINVSGNTEFCPGSYTSLVATGAENYVWSDGTSLDSIMIFTPGAYFVTGIDSNGCSNTVYSVVTNSQIYTIPFTHGICQGESYDFYGQELTTTGVYTHTLQTVNGCDSVIKLTLTVWPTSFSEFTVEIQDSCYTWNEMTYCETGDYTQMWQTEYGCDSVVTLHLVILLGVSGVENSDMVQVYPNPTSGQFFVIARDNMYIQLYDACGKLIYSNSFNDTCAHVDISNYTPGVYLLKILYGDRVIGYKKIVKI